MNRVLDAYRNWKETRKTVMELRNLSVRQLSDIGLRRSDLHRPAVQTRGDWF